MSGPDESSLPDPVVLGLGALLDVEGDGAHWALEGPSQLNANLVHLDPGHEVGEHTNAEVDVLLVALSGRGEVVVDGRAHAWEAPAVAHVPRGARRAVRAGAQGITYLTTHRRRGPLGIGSSPACAPRPVPVDRAGPVTKAGTRQGHDAGAEQVHEKRGPVEEGPVEEGGDPACWSHLFEGAPGGEGGTRY